MLVTIATVRVEPAAVDRARETLGALAEASREDDGCRAYSFNQDVEEPTTFRSVEVWDGQAQVDAHMGTPHVASAIETLTPHLTAEIDIQHHVVTD